MIIDENKLYMYDSNTIHYHIQQKIFVYQYKII